MTTSPTQLTLKSLRNSGWLAVVVEHWNPHAQIRQDLFGFIDILALKGAETLAVQACNYTDVSKRINKISEHDNVAAVREAGWQIQVHGWHKVAGRYQVRVVDVS